MEVPPCVTPPSACSGSPRTRPSTGRRLWRGMRGSAASEARTAQTRPVRRLVPRITEEPTGPSHRRRRPGHPADPLPLRVAGSRRARAPGLVPRGRLGLLALVREVPPLRLRLAPVDARGRGRLRTSPPHASTGSPRHHSAPRTDDEIGHRRRRAPAAADPSPSTATAIGRSSERRPAQEVARPGDP